MNKLNQRIANQKGFTITETLVAIGLMAILTLGISTVWSNTLDMQASVQVLQDISAFETRLKKLMADEVVCKHNFGGKVLPDVAAPGQSNSLAVNRIETGPGGVLVFDQISKRFEGKAEITSVRIVNQYAFASTKAVANVELAFTDKSKRVFKRSLPLVFVTGAGNTISTCSGSTVIIENATIKTACEVVSEGTMRYNEVLKKCEPYPTVDFPGTTYAAQCGAGHRLISCSYTNSNYQPPLVDIVFQNGGPSKTYVGEFKAIPDRGNNSCECDYTPTFLAATPAVLCVAKCTQSSQ